MSEFTKKEAELYALVRQIYEEMENPLHPCNFQGQVNMMSNSDFLLEDTKGNLIWNVQPFINVAPTNPQTAIDLEENKNA